MTWERFPTDEVSLTMLEAACNINPDTGHTELRRFLDMTGGEVTSVTMNGIVYGSVEEALADAEEGYGPPILEVEHDKAPHSEHTIIVSLIEEIRRLRLERDYWHEKADRHERGWDAVLLHWGQSILRRKREVHNTERES